MKLTGPNAPVGLKIDLPRNYLSKKLGFSNIGRLVLSRTRHVYFSIVLSLLQPIAAPFVLYVLLASSLKCACHVKSMSQLLLAQYTPGLAEGVRYLDFFCLWSIVQCMCYFFVVAMQC